ncbi:MAG: glucosaminidase domain-containing protein [Pelodictyon phaeoclathratiforme]
MTALSNHNIFLANKISRKYFNQAILLFFFFVTSLIPSQNIALAANRVTTDYVITHKNHADSKAAEYSIPANVILAIALVESGAGTSRVATKLNNHFGLTGKNNASWKSQYKQYQNTEESYDHFCKFIAKKVFYDKLKRGAEPEQWITAISKTNYAGNAGVWKRTVLGALNAIKTI